ncbi:MAG TPA: type II toxin-antitoxin system VapC family toxin [Acetobacteraceae bacterium]|nr:type II toxin-antitoxin system VapC family toxin [Acetobacteraceae bacterium]
MSFLLDTNVVSEATRPRPNDGVMAWLAAADEDAVFLSVITLAELQRGVDRLPAGRRHSQLDVWLREELPLRFTGRMLPIDEAVAEACGHLVARGEALGRTISAMDGFLAATAMVHQLTLVTRNVVDFRQLVSRILNPWSGG